MRPLVALALAALLTASLAGCADDNERYPDGVPTRSTGPAPTQGPGNGSSSTGTATATSSTTTTGDPGANQAPNATLSAAPTNGTAPLNVTFQLEGDDPDGDALSWTLVFGDGNQTSGTSLPAMANHTYGPGNHTAVLQVLDGRGGNASSNATIRASSGGGGGGGGGAPPPVDACTRPDAVGAGAEGTFWVDHRGGDSVWVYEETNGVPGLQLSNGVSPIPAPIGGHTDPLGVNCLNGDSFYF